MGLPRITYNGVNIDFLNDIDELDPQYPDQNPKNTAVSGVGEALIARNDVIVHFGQSMEIDEDLKRKLRNWHEWAKKGRPWTIARDRDEVVLVQLAVPADEGDATIELTDTSGVVVGKQYVIRTETLLQVVKVASVSVPIVTLEEPLDYDFPGGSRFRSEMFWPGRLIPNTNPIVSGRVLYGISLDFKEDMNDFSIDPPFTGLFTVVEEYDNEAGAEDVNPARSHIDNGANAIDGDDDTYATCVFHSSSSLTPNYSSLLISGAPEPPGLFTNAVIHVITEFVTGGSPDVPLFTCDVFNQRNTALIDAGSTTGQIDNLQGGFGDTAKAEFTVTYSAAEFATHFPGGAADIYLRCGCYHSLNFTCSPDTGYRIYRASIEYLR